MLAQILLLVQTPEESHAIDQLYRRAGDQMKARAINILHNDDDAEDALMATFQYICEQPERFMQYTNPKIISLACLKAECVAIDIYRKKKFLAENIVSLNDEIAVNLPDVNLSNIAVSKENGEMVHIAMSRLVDKYRIPTMLKYFYQMRNIEIATYLKIPQETVATRLNYAKKLMKKYCIEMGYTNE